MNALAGFALRSATLLMLAHALLGQAVMAEPYIAVQKGLKCMVCHTSSSGGGKRTAYGNAYATLELPAHTLDFGKSWTGDIGRYLAVGGDIRGGWNQLDVPGQGSASATELDEFLAYVELRPLPQYLTLHVDAKLGPDDPIVREAYARLSLDEGRWTIKAGEFFLPFGLRLQDDSAFIRQVTGINFNTPDSGWEVAFEGGAWSAQLAVTRGTAGGPEVDSGKQYSLRVSHVTSKWRVGGSYNFNDSKFGDRQMQGVFAGMRTGPVSWLAELDLIIDDGTSTGRRKLWASLIEANYRFKKGHNLKLTFEFFDPDSNVSENERNRLSVVWEYFPLQFFQTRLGYRRYRGIPQNPAQNREQLFAELHIAF
ncbi:MAG: hypothetical protein IID58_11780 [Proteobacteria bacterium]|nr:hypothetical protein [Pseudomonadota bacterium]